MHHHPLFASFPGGGGAGRFQHAHSAIIYLISIYLSIETEREMHHNLMFSSSAGGGGADGLQHSRPAAARHM